jgi:hypothetical protein
VVSTQLRVTTGEPPGDPVTVRVPDLGTPFASGFEQWTSTAQLEPPPRAVPLHVSDDAMKWLGSVPPMEVASVPLGLWPELVTVKVWSLESPRTVP